MLILYQTMNTSMTSGKVSVTIPENEGFTFICKKTSGDIDSDFDLKTSINGDKNTFTYLSGGTAGLKYNVKMTSGTFKLLKAHA